MKHVSEKDIREQLKRILKSDEIHRSKRLCDFLTYVTEKHLAGESATISGYTIGIDVFEKPLNFDSDNDSSVRVEASRLRKALTLYYHGPGKHDPIILEIPKGSYIPAWTANPNTTSSSKATTIRALIFTVILCITSLVRRQSAPRLQPQQPTS